MKTMGMKGARSLYRKARKATKENLGSFREWARRTLKVEGTRGKLSRIVGVS